MRDALFHLERARPATLQAQIREILIEAIRKGQLRAGDPVPSTRARRGAQSIAREGCSTAGRAVIPSTAAAST